MNVVHWYDFVLRVGVAVVAGALIGLERQWRSRGGGLRRNSLVAAGAATAAILAINILLRPVGRRIDHQPIDEDSDIETMYRFHANTKDASEAHARAVLLQTISGHGYQLRAIESANLPGTNLGEVKAELVTAGRNDQHIETARRELDISVRGIPSIRDAAGS